MKIYELYDKNLTAKEIDDLVKQDSIGVIKNSCNITFCEYCCFGKISDITKKTCSEEKNKWLFSNVEDYLITEDDINFLKYLKTGYIVCTSGNTILYFTHKPVQKVDNDLNLYWDGNGIKIDRDSFRSYYKYGEPISVEELLNLGIICNIAKADDLLNNIKEYMSEHEQLFTDFLNHYNHYVTCHYPDSVYEDSKFTKPIIKSQLLREYVEFLGEHKTAEADFMNHYSYTKDANDRYVLIDPSQFK